MQGHVDPQGFSPTGSSPSNHVQTGMILAMMVLMIPALLLIGAFGNSSDRQKSDLIYYSSGHCGSSETCSAVVLV